MLWSQFMVRAKKPPWKSILEYPNVRQTVISRNSVTPWLALLRQIGHHARDQSSHRPSFWSSDSYAVYWFCELCVYELPRNPLTEL